MTVNLGLYSFLGLRIGTNGEFLWSARAVPYIRRRISSIAEPLRPSQQGLNIRQNNPNFKKAKPEVRAQYLFSSQFYPSPILKT